MWKYPCIACMGLMLFGARVVFIVDVCHLFPQCMLVIIPLIGGLIIVVVTRALDIEQGLPFVLSGTGSAP